MPKRDGTGPLGQGSVPVKKVRQKGQHRVFGVGSSDYCICSKCGEKLIHTVGIPCNAVKCPKCGAFMTRSN